VLAAIAVAVVIAAGAALVTFVIGIDRVRFQRTVARSAVMAGAVALVVFGAVLGPRLGGSAWQQFRHPALVERAGDPAARLTHLGGARYFYWRAALDAFKAKPITGEGAGTFEFWWDRYGLTGDFIRNAHSIELESMAELGIPGLLLIAAVMAAAIALVASARRKTRRVTSVGASAALLTALLVYLFQASIDWMWQSTAVTVLALAAVGVAAGRLSRGRPRLPWYARLGVGVAALCAALVQVPGLVSTSEIRQSQAAERAGNASGAYSWANAAVSAEPWAASPYEQRGLVLEAAGKFAPAAMDLHRAVSREPDNFAHWLLLSRIETEQGDLAAATQAYARARQLRPKALVFYYAPYFSALPQAR
jgi:cytochrome c-type biogenesis protein CcmH/NrfG